MPERRRNANKTLEIVEVQKLSLVISQLPFAPLIFSMDVCRQMLEIDGQNLWSTGFDPRSSVIAI